MEAALALYKDTHMKRNLLIGWALVVLTLVGVGAAAPINTVFESYRQDAVARAAVAQDYVLFSVHHFTAGTDANLLIHLTADPNTFPATTIRAAITPDTDGNVPVAMLRYGLGTDPNAYASAQWQNGGSSKPVTKATADTLRVIASTSMPCTLEVYVPRN